MSDTRISVSDGLLVTGIPRARRDSTAPRIGRMERTSRSRFLRTLGMWRGKVGDRRSPADWA